MDDHQCDLTLSDADGNTVGPFSTADMEAAAKLDCDPLTPDAADLVITSGKASTSYIQRSLHIGYNKAAKIMETLEELCVVSAPNHVGKREVLTKAVPMPLIVKAAVLKSITDAVGATLKEHEVDKRIFGKAAGPDGQFPAVEEHSYNVAGEELRQFIERYERLEAEKKDITEGQKEVMAEAKARGYDTKIVRKVIALRKRDKDDLAEEEAVLEMYKAALGMK